jgi:BirA family biotin operon repressor/biotin-[acetyl-CoA-carboxylase] ligase
MYGVLTAIFMFNAEEFCDATFVRRVEIHETLGSTNDRAAELARRTAIDLPALVVARIQTAGRGRGKNVWCSTDGALTFSLLLDSNTIGVSPEKWPRLSLTTAVAACDALSTEIISSNRQSASSTSAARFPRIGIKWPNDVLLDGKKACGILVESPGGSAPAKDRIIVGIGVNVNNSLRARLDDEIAIGIALCDVTAQPHNLQNVLIGILQAFATRIAQLRNDDPCLVKEWRRLDQLAGKQLVLDSGGERIEGTGTNIAEDGALVVSTATGQKQIYSGSVRFK